MNISKHKKRINLFSSHAFIFACFLMMSFINYGQIESIVTTSIPETCNNTSFDDCIDYSFQYSYKEFITFKHDRENEKIGIKMKEGFDPKGESWRVAMDLEFNDFLVLQYAKLPLCLESFFLEPKLLYIWGGEVGSHSYDASVNFAQATARTKSDLTTRWGYRQFRKGICTKAIYTGDGRSNDTKSTLQALLMYSIAQGFNSPDDTAGVEMVVNLSGNVNLFDIEYISLPGGRRITPDELSQDLNVKGINFTVRNPLSDQELDDMGISYNDGYSSTISITQSLLPSTDNNLISEIAVPRIINPDVMNGLPGTFKSRDPGSFSTNMIVYPKNNSFNVVATNDIGVLSRMFTFDGSTGELNIEDQKEIFKAKVLVEGVEVEKVFYSYNLSTTSNKIGIKIDGEGPFPYAFKANINVVSPEITETNKKMHQKNVTPTDEKFLIAWHRGFWRDAPENTLQSIAAAKVYLPTSDMLELDISRASDLNSDLRVHNYILYHDPFMFRESSTGPNNDQHKCIDPYDQILVESTLLAFAKRAELKALLESRFTGYTEQQYTDWMKAPNDFTLDELRNMTVRDRFGCLTDIKIPTLTQGIQAAKDVKLPIMVDKGMDDIDNIYWHAIKNDYENEVYFKGQADSRDPIKLTKMYGNELFKQIVYTPYYFDNVAQKPENFINGKLKHLEDFIDKESNEGWIIPGFELQIKVSKEEAIAGGVAKGFSPDGVQRLLDFNAKYRATKWMGITQINPTAYNGFDNKIIFMDATDDASASNSYSSRHDRRADLMFNLNDIKCDYWTTDRPDVVVNFLKQIGLMKLN